MGYVSILFEWIPGDLRLVDHIKFQENNRSTKVFQRNSWAEQLEKTIGKTILGTIHDRIVSECS